MATVVDADFSQMLYARNGIIGSRRRTATRDPLDRTVLILCGLREGPNTRHVEPYLQPCHASFIARLPAELKRGGFDVPSPKFDDQSKVVASKGGRTLQLKRLTVDLES